MHTKEQDLSFFQNKVLPTQNVDVEIREGHVAGFIAYESDWVNQLYIDPKYWRLGIGSSLLAQALQGVSFRQLWVFEQNNAAQTFYARHGFKVAERTDGSNNHEGCPDLRMEWRA